MTERSQRRDCHNECVIVQNIASLTIDSDTHAAAAVTELLGIQPTKAGEKDELRSRSRDGREFLYRHAHWSVTIRSDGGAAGDDGYESLREIAAIFDGKGPVLQKLVSDYSMRVLFTATSDDMNTALSLPPDVLSALAALGVRLDATVYPTEPEPGLVVEHVVLPVIVGREVEFETAFAEAQHIVLSMPGCREVSLSRGVEHPNTYLLLIRWDTVEDHEIGFRQSPEYLEWKALLHHFYDPFPTVEHYTEVYRAL